MAPVRVVVETREGVVEYIAHVNNRSKHCLTGALRAAWRRYPAAKAVSAQFTTHECDTCNRTHNVTQQRRVFHRVSKRGAA